MDEKYISDLYNQLGGKSVFGEYNDFKSLINTDDSYASDVYNQMGGESVFGKYDDFRNLTKSSPSLQLKKKGDTTESPSEVGSLASSASADPEALRFAELASKQGAVQDLFKKTGTPLPSQPVEGRWKGAPSYVDPRNMLGMYPTKEQADRATAQAMADIDVSTGMIPEYEEKDFFEGGAKSTLEFFDKYVPVFNTFQLGEAIDDTARTLASGYAQGQLASVANDLLLSGTTPDDETIEKLIEYGKMAKELGPSDAFINYQKKSEEVGGGAWGFFRGVMDNPAVLPELLVNSLTAMATNKEAVIAGAGTVLTNALATAAAAGAPTAGTGAAPGFAAGAVAAIPAAMGIASGILTTGATFSELLQQELGTDEFGNPIEPTKENTKAILEDPEKFNKLRNKSILKGATVGAIDFFTGKLASSVGAKILSKSAAKSATGEATRAAYTRSVGTGSAIESTGGALGEFAGTGIAGEKQNIENILFEAVTEMPMGALSTAQARLAAPVYKVNKKKVTAEQIDEIIDTMEPADLAVAKIEIENDYEGRKKRMQDKIVTGSIANEVRAAQPDLNEPTVNAIVDLQKQLNALEGNKTQVAKDKAAQIRAEIKNLQENPIIETKPKEDAIQEQAAGEVPVQSGATVSQEVAQGEPQAEPQVVAEEGEKEVEIKPIVVGDKVLDSDGVEYEVVGLFTSRKGTQQAEVRTPKRTDAQIEEDARRNVFNRNENRLLYKDSNDPKFIKEQSIAISQEISDQTAVNNSSQGSTTLDLVDLKKAEPQVTAEAVVQEEVVPAETRIAELEKEKSKLTSKALKQFPQSPAQLKTRARIDEINTELNAIKSEAEVVSSKTPETTKEVEELVSQDVEPAPKLVRDVSVLITPATVRADSPVTKRLKALSLKYDKLVKEFSKKKDKVTLDKIKETEAQILNDAKQEIIDDVSKVKGVAVAFGPDKRGLWDGKFEPSLNMVLSISQQADTESVSKMLFDFAEKYSQDAFILESESNYEKDVFEGKRGTPLTEFDENGLMHYPQIIYTFAKPITDEQVADLSVSLQNNGVDAFSINNNDIKVSVIKFFPDDSPLNEDQQNEERKRDLESKSDATEKSALDVLGPNVTFTPEVRIKKSSYQGARNEGTKEQSREYDRSNVLESFKETITNVEVRSTELANLRKKQIQLQKEGKQLSKEEQNRFDELNRDVQPTVQKTFEVNKALYEEAKTEVEKIAADAIKNLNASLSPFPIKRPERASVKAIRWYNSFTERLGDGARVNIVVQSDADADKAFNSIDQKYPVAKDEKDLRRIKEDTNLGYPKKLIEVRTSNGIIAEIQVITTDAYLAKDGVSGFTGDQKQKDSAKKALAKIRQRLGWSIPDGLGHYFYEIHRDVNVDDALRADALKLSNLYYDAFTNPESTLTESFMDDVIAFKKKVDNADKTNWDKGNEGKTPPPLTEYINQEAKKPKTKKQPQVSPAAAPITITDIKVSFAPENAIEVQKGTREDTRGRKFTYDAAVTAQATDKNGVPIGIMTKRSDADGKLSFTLKDVSGRNINKGKAYPTERDARAALVEQVNKQREKPVTQAVAAKDEAQAEAVEQVQGKLDELLTLDPKAKGTGKKILDGIDNLIKEYEDIEKKGLNLGLALSSIKEILKGIRALVEAGIVLADAIKKVAKDNNVSAKDVIDGINAIGQIAPIQAAYDALMTKADALIARQTSRGITEKKIVSNLDTMIRKSEVYKNANDAQRKIMEREARAKMGVGPRKAASIGRVIGVLKDITNVTREEKLKIISRIRELGKDVGRELAKEIRAMKVNGQITTFQATNIIARLANVNTLNETSVSNFVDYMAEVFAKVKEKNRQSLLNDLVKLVSAKAKTAKTESGKRRSKGLDAVGQSFFDAIKPIIKAAAKGDTETLQKIKQSIDNDLIETLIIKTINGEELTTRERVLLDQALAYDTFADLANMDIEQIQKLFDQLKDARTESIAKLKSRRIERAQEVKALHDEVDANIKEGFGILYNEDGTLKNENQLRAESDAIWESFSKLKIWDGVKKLFERYDFTVSKNIFDFVRKTVSHIGTISNILDKKGKFFTDNVYRALNKMDTAHLEGYFNQREILDEMANKIDGITKGFRDFRSKMSNKVIVLDNIIDSKTKSKFKNPINQDQAMRIYALYKNPIQRAKLVKMGFDEATMKKIEDFIGADGMQMADMIVDYFSNDYYESVNKVYRKVNDVSLGYVENYFPTQTIAANVDGDMLINGNFSGIFDAETAPSLKERTDTTSDVLLGAAFTDVVESHIQTMERYKAYAEGVKRINSIFKSPAVQTLLGRYGTELSSVYKSLINFAVNPNGGAKIQQTLLDKVMNKFAGFALAFKLVQIPKQATSFITAFEDYNFRGEGKNKIPGLDMLMFMVDAAKTIATLPTQVKKALEISASFKDRLEKGLDGDVYGLESGSATFKSIGKSNNLIDRTLRALKKGSGFPTVLGDILGVMGYMINYNRNIANGMSEADALEAFNNYNATQQSRRAADKIPLQQSQSALVRAFTMFGSTTFLQINKAVQGTTNIMRSLKAKKMPEAKDMRAVALNVALANAFFVLASNMAKLIDGDEEDEEEVLKAIGEALLGLNLVYQIPLIGGAVELAIKKANNDNRPVSDVINPYITVFNKIYKGVKEDDIIKSGQPIIEIILGTQLDQFVGLFNTFGEGFTDENVYDMLGISKSYRPGGGVKDSDSKDTKQEEMTKTEMKKRMPKLYKEVYGETDDIMKEIRKERKDILKESGIEIEDEDLSFEN